MSVQQQIETYGLVEAFVVCHKFLVLLPSGNEVVWNAVEYFPVNLRL